MKYIKKFESILPDERETPILYLKDFNGKNLMFEAQGYKLFKIDNFNEIDGFDKSSAICFRKEYFDGYNRQGDIHFLFKDGIYIYSFSVDKNSEISVLTTPGNKYYKLEEIKDIDSGAYKIIKTFASTPDSLRKINESTDLDDLNGAKLMINTNGYKLFRIDNYEQIKDFKLSLMASESFFDMANSSSYIYIVFKDDIYYLSFRVAKSRNEPIEPDEDEDLDMDYKGNYDHSNSIFDIIRRGGNENSTYMSDVRYLEEIEEQEPILLKLMLSTRNSYDLDNTMRKINKPIQEFWEWSKNSYGMDKHKVDSQTTMTKLNTQHGYGEEGQWVQTQDGDVFIEEISDNRYKGYDRDGEAKTGSIKDIIRTLIKKEVIRENKETKKRKRYGVVMLHFDASSSVFEEVQELVSDEDIYSNGNEYPKGGREKEPHVTVLFGLHSEVSDETIESIIDTWKQPEISFKNISIFEDNNGKGYDVVKFDIDNEDLNEMNKQLTELPHTTDYPDYHPHITIAFVTAGKGEKYIQTLDTPIKMNPSKIVYKKADGSKKEYEFE
tara:strand:+ start:5652 stop:7304 length:1653 start_codon:yes stop_codon:yes gene_type:complete